MRSTAPSEHGEEKFAVTVVLAFHTAQRPSRKDWMKVSGRLQKLIVPGVNFLEIRLDVTMQPFDNVMIV